MKTLLFATLALVSSLAFANDMQVSNHGTAHKVAGTTVLLQGRDAVRLYNALNIPAVNNKKSIPSINGVELQCIRMMPTGAKCVIGDALNVGSSNSELAVFDENTTPVSFTEVSFTGRFATALYFALNAEEMHMTGYEGKTKTVGLTTSAIWPLQGDGLVCQFLTQGEINCGLITKRF